MRSETHTLTVPTTAADGAERTCKDLLDKWVQVGGDMTGFTVDVQGTINSVDWVSVVAGITATGIYEVPHGLVKIRIKTVVAPAPGPEPTATLFGRNAESN